MKMNAPKPILDFNDLAPIDTGTSSKLFRATHTFTKQSVVLKRYSIKEISKREADYVSREMNIHKSVEHPFIAAYYGAVKTNDEFILVLENVVGQSLLAKINESGGLFEFEVQKIFSQLICALMYLHNDCKISHRDLKLENIMLDTGGNIKIIDFGVSNNVEGLMNTQCGSFPYCAPELLKGQSYTNKVDIWSAAVILFTLFTGEFPFEEPNVSACSQKILNEEPPYPTHLSMDAINLMQKMFDKNPDTRISVDEISQHPWLLGSHCNVSSLNENIKRLGLMQIGPQVPIDNAILELCRKKGLNTNLIVSQLQTKQDTNMTMTYRILRWNRNTTQFRRMYSNMEADTQFITSPPMYIPVQSPQRRSRAISNSPVPYINYPDSYPAASALVPTHSARGTGLPKLEQPNISNQGSSILVHNTPIISKIQFPRGFKIRASKPNIRPSPITPCSSLPLDNQF